MLVLLCLMLFVLLLTNGGQLRERYVCVQCGMHMTATLQQIPATGITLTTWQHLEATSLSIAMYKHRLVGAHRHQWKFAFGAGNTVSCMLGKYGNRSVYMRTNNASLGNFIAMLVEYRSWNEAQQWCHRVLDVQVRKPIMLPMPEQRLPRSSFEALIRENRKELLLD